MGYRFRVLLVEDNPGDVLLVKSVMSSIGMNTTVEVARNGEYALQLLRGELPDTEALVPDLVLLDLNVPVKSGRQVLAEMKADPQLTSIPVIVLSSSAREYDVSSCYALGANCYVAKPLDLDVYEESLRALGAFWIDTAQLSSFPDIDTRSDVF